MSSNFISDCTASLGYVELNIYGRDESNVANGIAPVLAKYFNFDRWNPPAMPDIIANCSNSTTPYFLAEDESFIALKNMVEHIDDSKCNKRELMLAVAQIILRSGCFINKCRLPEIIYVISYDKYCDFIKEYYPDNVKYFSSLPAPVNIKNAFSIDKSTSIKLDKVAKLLFEVSLNKAVFNLFEDFLAYSENGSKEENVFGLLHESLIRKLKAAKYMPDDKFMSELLLLSNEYITNEKSVKKNVSANNPLRRPSYLKTMEFFLLLSQDFGYQIPQDLKIRFKNKINLILNTIKSVLSNYNNIKLADKICDISVDVLKKCDPMSDDFTSISINIDAISELIISTPVNKICESVDLSNLVRSFRFDNPQDFIANDFTIINYSCSDDDANRDSDIYSNEDDEWFWSRKDKVKDFMKRLQPLMPQKAKNFIENIMNDFDFPLYENFKYGYRHKYYLQNGYYNISSENSVCYLNLINILSLMANSPYPYEFVSQTINNKLPEIMPFISTAFCDISGIC